MAKHSAPVRSHTTLSYQLIRNTTSPDESATGVKSYVANLTAFEILKVGTGSNLRTYLAEYNPRKRTQVHEAILYTIETEPARFITRNSGFVIAASDAEIDDGKKSMKLYDASIINGAQSQGEILRWVKAQYGENGPNPDDETPFYVRAEIVVDPDHSEIVETAIARNTATPVKSISQAGARGHLNDLEKSIMKVHPSIKIRKSETDENVYDTRKILQYTRLLMPKDVADNDSTAEKLRPYKNPEQCLSDFSDWWEAHDKKSRDMKARLKYDFTVEMAPHAISEYEYWERHPAWNGHHIWDETNKGGRACRRDGNGKIVWVSPGLIFPLVGAMSEFVEMDAAGNWRINKPKIFRPGEMIASAVKQFRNVDSDPMQMGRDGGVYDALRIYPSTLVEVMREMKKQ